MTDSTRDHQVTQPTAPLPATLETPADPGTLPRPRIRFGAIVWGLIVCTIAVITFWIATDPARRDAFGDWLLGLTPGTAGLIALLVIGALLLLWGALAAIRRAQDRRAPRL